jgi:hypothetical protein
MSIRKLIFLNHFPDEKFETLKLMLIEKILHDAMNLEWYCASVVTLDVEQIRVEISKPLLIEQDTIMHK